MSKYSTNHSRRQQTNLSPFKERLKPVSATKGSNIPTYSPLKNYTEEEFKQIVLYDPTFLAIDKDNYSDKDYVYYMCKLYLHVAQTSTSSLRKIAHFKISDLETALIKLSEKLPDNYKQVSNYFGVNPHTHRSVKTNYRGKNVPLGAIHKMSCGHELWQLCNWGYIEMFSPNMQNSIENVAKKMYSSAEMSNLEKAQYAHLFFLLIYGFHIMPYDLTHYVKLCFAAEKKGEVLTREKKLELLDEASKQMHQLEKDTIYAAVMLHSAYDAFFSNFPDESINIDMIQLFLDEVPEYSEKLKIKEFFGILSESEKTDFELLEITPIKTNLDLRFLKENIFKFGEWHSTLKLFYVDTEEKLKKSIASACRKFTEDGFVFAKNAEPLKKPITHTNIGNGSLITKNGYLYAKSPLSIRISDINELRMMVLFCKYHNL